MCFADALHIVHMATAKPPLQHADEEFMRVGCWWAVDLVQEYYLVSTGCVQAQVHVEVTLCSLHAEVAKQAILKPTRCSEQ